MEEALGLGANYVLLKPFDSNALVKKIRQIKNGKIKESEIKELPYQHMEKINWWKKGTAFLKAKFAGKRYEGSF